MKTKLLLITILSILIMSCKKEELITPDSTRNVVGIWTVTNICVDDNCTSLPSNDGMSATLNIKKISDRDVAVYMNMVKNGVNTQTSFALTCTEEIDYVKLWNIDLEGNCTLTKFYVLIHENGINLKINASRMV